MQYSRERLAGYHSADFEADNVAKLLAGKYRNDESGAIKIAEALITLKKCDPQAQQADNKLRDLVTMTLKQFSYKYNL